MVYSVTASQEYAMMYRTDTGVLVTWNWCKETFGDPQEAGWWYDDVIGHGIRTFHFNNEADAVLFALKWA